MTRVSRIYTSNCTLYENIVSGNDDITYDRKENHYAVSKELLELGVDDIYSWKGNVFFEHKEKVLDTVDNSQINVLTQRTMHRICTAATNEEVSFAYRVAIPRQRFRWRNAFSTRWRSL